MNNSIWCDNISFKEGKRLEENIEVDVLIIGGGITGISTAYHLIDKNLKVALVEKNKILSAVTSKTTGKLTYLQEDIYKKLEKNYDIETSKKYLSSQIDAIKIVADIVKKNKIDCNLEEVSSYVFTNEEENIKRLKDEKDLLTKFEKQVEEKTSLPNNEKVKYAIKVNDTYVFHPLKYLTSLAQICNKHNIDIYEDTKIEEINKENKNFICKTKTNTIKAKKVVLALHYPYFLMPFLTPFKTTLEKSYLKAKKVDKFLNFSAINIDKPSISIRYHKDKNKNYKIELTNSHNNAFKNNDKNNFQDLKNTTYDYLWSNIDIMTNDYLPYIGKLSDNLLIGTGYNTWGMTNGSIAGKILSDIILNNENEYIELFNPKRKLNIPKVINFPITLISTAKSFIGSKINKNKSWYKNVKFVRENGKSIGIYIDEEGVEHKIYNRCPHLTCGLIFNEIELTWDCPCHGSRFDIDGNCIEGPSNYDIKYKN